MFDVDDTTNIQFYYEFMDTKQYLLINNRSYYSYYSSDNTLVDAFSPIGWTWNILYYNNTQKALIISQDNNTTGLILLQSFKFDGNLLSFITTIVTKLNLNILTKLKVFPEENCQTDGLPMQPGFMPKMLFGKWWYGALIWDSGVYDCLSVKITNQPPFCLAFQWSQGNEAYLFPKPTQQALLIEDAQGMVGSFSGVVSHLSDKQDMFIWTYTTTKFGIVFSKTPNLSSEQITEAVNFLTNNMGYYIVQDDNFFVADNSNCESDAVVAEEIFA